MHNPTIATLALATLLVGAACDGEPDEDEPSCAAWLACYERCRLAAWDDETKGYTANLRSCAGSSGCGDLLPYMFEQPERWIPKVDQKIADLLPSASLCRHHPTDEDACDAASELAYPVAQATLWRVECLDSDIGRDDR